MPALPGRALWSARLLREAPEAIAAVHAAYLEAGADCITTASYQATVPGLVRQGLGEDEARSTLLRSVELARHCRARHLGLSRVSGSDILDDLIDHAACLSGCVTTVCVTSDLFVTHARIGRYSSAWPRDVLRLDENSS